MAKQDVKITITFDYDPEENEGKPEHIFLFQLLNNLNRDLTPIKEITYKQETKIFENPEVDIPKIALRKVDSISDGDLPKEPVWLKDRTILEAVNTK